MTPRSGRWRPRFGALRRRRVPPHLEWMVPSRRTVGGELVAMTAALSARRGDPRASRPHPHQRADQCRLQPTRSTPTDDDGRLSRRADDLQEPLCLYDCDAPCEGATAVIVSRRDAPTACAHPLTVESDGRHVRTATSDQRSDITTMAATVRCLRGGDTIHADSARRRHGRTLRRLLLPDGDIVEAISSPGTATTNTSATVRVSRWTVHSDQHQRSATFSDQAAWHRLPAARACVPRRYRRGRRSATRTTKVVAMGVGGGQGAILWHGDRSLVNDMTLGDVVTDDAVPLPGRAPRAGWADRTVTRAQLRDPCGPGRCRRWQRVRCATPRTASRWLSRNSVEFGEVMAATHPPAASSWRPSTSGCRPVKCCDALQRVSPSIVFCSDEFASVMT